MASDPHADCCASLPVEVVEIRPGRSVAVHRRGAASTSSVVIFVHGSAASMLQWRAQADFFASQGYAVVLYDWLGCGRSPKPVGWSLYAMDELYEDCKAIVRAHQATRTVLVAHSAGCTLALRLAAEAEAQAEAEAGGGAASPTMPRPPSAVALIGPLVGGPPLPLRLIFRLPLFVLEYIQPTLSAGFADMALHEKTRAGATEAHRQLLAMSATLSGSNEMHMCKAYYRQLKGIPEAPPPIRAPTLLLVGEADVLAPADVHARRLHALLGLARDVHLVPDAAHQCMQEQPEAVNAALLEFARAAVGSEKRGWLPFVS